VIAGEAAQLEALPGSRPAHRSSVGKLQAAGGVQSRGVYSMSAESRSFAPNEAPTNTISSSTCRRAHRACWRPRQQNAWTQIGIKRHKGHRPAGERRARQQRAPPGERSTNRRRNTPTLAAANQAVDAPYSPLLVERVPPTRPTAHATAISLSPATPAPQQIFGTPRRPGPCARCYPWPKQRGARPLKRVVDVALSRGGATVDSVLR